MRKIFTLLLLGGLLFVGAGKVLADDITVYFAISTNKVLADYSLALTVNDGSWSGNIAMTNTKKTFGGKYVYKGTFTTSSTNIWDLQFKLMNGEGTQVSYNWTIKNTYTSMSDINNRLFDDNDVKYDTYSIYTNWGAGDWAHELIFDGITKTLSAGDHFEFKMCKNMTEWWGSNTGIKWYSASNFTLNQDNNCTLYTNFAGTYTFTNSGFSLTVAYPTQTYTAYFEKPSTWTQVKAHIFRNEDSSDHALNTWPGQEITDIEGNYYKATFAATAEPTGIIWNNLTSGEGEVGTSRTSNLTFVEDGIYWFANNGEIIPSFTVNFTSEDGYATFYHPTKNVLLPSGVTAYSVGYSAPILNLTAFSGENDNVIPANKAVILTGPAGGSATLYNTGKDAYGDCNSVLYGSDGSVSGGDYIYVLGTAGTGDVTGTAFYKLPSTKKVPANRAYLNTNGSPAPTAIRLENGENNTTNLERVETANISVKFIKNGQLYIMRDGVVYDVMGRIAE